MDQHCWVTISPQSVCTEKPGLHVHTYTGSSANATTSTTTSSGTSVCSEVPAECTALYMAAYYGFEQLCRVLLQVTVERCQITNDATRLLWQNTLNMHFMCASCLAMYH